MQRPTLNPRLNVAVAVADDARERIGEVAAACRARGFEHTATLSEIGVLTGSVGWGDLRKLRRVAGVMAVEIERRSLINRYQCMSRGRSLKGNAWGAAVAPASGCSCRT
jgi:hypothetical protein